MLEEHVSITEIAGGEFRFHDEVTNVNLGAARLSNSVDLVESGSSWDFGESYLEVFNEVVRIVVSEGWLKN